MVIRAIPILTSPRELMTESILALSNLVLSNVSAVEGAQIMRHSRSSAARHKVRAFAKFCPMLLVQSTKSASVGTSYLIKVVLIEWGSIEF